MNSKEQSRREYVARINRVMDYIDKNIDQNINLDTMAAVANFSPYHFHRIFTTVTGETPADFMQRIRIERAAQKLYDHTDTPISAIAYSCGFGSVSVFSRTFRKHFGMTAKEFREQEKPIFVQGGIRYSKNGKPLGNNRQLTADSGMHLCNVKLKDVYFMETKIEIKNMPEMLVVYCRHKGEFNQIGKAYAKLAQWAGPRGLLTPGTKTITVYHDDPAVTAIENVRQSAGIVIDHDVKVDGEIGKMIVEGGKYAVGRFEISVTEFEKAWNTICQWFTESGYQPGDGNCYELYHNDHTQHPEQKFILDICIPVKPL